MYKRFVLALIFTCVSAPILAANHAVPRVKAFQPGAVTLHANVAGGRLSPATSASVTILPGNKITVPHRSGPLEIQLHASNGQSSSGSGERGQVAMEVFVAPNPNRSTIKGLHDIEIRTVEQLPGGQPELRSVQHYVGVMQPAE